MTQQLDFGDVPAPGTPVSAQASLLTASTSTLLIRTDLFEPEGHRVCNLVTRYVHVDLRTRRSIPLAGERCCRLYNTMTRISHDPISAEQSTRLPLSSPPGAFHIPIAERRTSRGNLRRRSHRVITQLGVLVPEVRNEDATSDLLFVEDTLGN